LWTVRTRLLTRWRYRRYGGGYRRDIALGCRRRLHCDGREIAFCWLFNQRRIHDVLGLIILLASQVGKGEAGHEEHGSKNRGGARQERGRSTSAENGTRSATGTEARASIRSATLLQHDQSDDRKRDQDVDDH